jgi:hypothetical protein
MSTATSRAECSQAAWSRTGPIASNAWVRTLWPSAIIIALAVLTQATWDTSTDVSWLITLCEKTLDGQRPYVDFIESNPPAAIYLYMPGTLAARLLGLRPEFMVPVTGFLAAIASLGLSAMIMARAGLAERFGPTGLAVAVSIFTLLPGRTFDQREHLALLAGLPLLAVMISRASGRRGDILLQILAGAGGAAMAAVKPHFALIVLAALPYLAWRAGIRAVFTCVAFYAAICVSLVYVAATVAFFPAYLENVAPLVMAVYAPVREPFIAMIGSSGFLCWVLLGVYLLVLSRGEIGEPAVAVPALASLGAVVAFLIQGKGWPYHSYPAAALMALALGLSLRDCPKMARRLGVGAICFVLLAAIARLAPTAHAYAYYLAATISAFFVAFWTLARNSPRWRRRAASFAAPAVASAIAFAYVWFSHLNGSPPLQAAATTLGPHPKILAITQDPGVGFPLTRQVGGIWAQRAAMLWITSGARRLLEGAKDPEQQSKLESYLRLDRDILLEDIERNRPDIILISNRFGEFHHWAFADPLIAVALANYKLYAEDGDPNGETFLYARAELLTSRSHLSNVAEPSGAHAR